MGIGLSRSDPPAPALPGWVWGSSPWSQGPDGGQGGIPGSGRKAGVSQRAPGLSAELGASAGSAAYQVHPCGGSAHETKGGTSLAPPLRSPDLPPNNPRAPAAPGEWRGGSVAVYLQLPALGPHEDALRGSFDPPHLCPPSGASRAQPPPAFPNIVPHPPPAPMPCTLAEAGVGLRAWHGPGCRGGQWQDGGRRGEYLWQTSSSPATCGSHCPPAPGPRPTEWSLR